MKSESLLGTTAPHSMNAMLDIWRQVTSVKMKLKVPSHLTVAGEQCPVFEQVPLRVRLLTLCTTAVVKAMPENVCVPCRK